MSLVTSRIFPLVLGVIRNTLNQIGEQSNETVDIKARDTRTRGEKVKRISDTPAPAEEVKLSPFEAARELHENDRRQSVLSAMEFLKSRKILKNLDRNLGNIVNSRSEEGLGFKSKIEISKEDVFIKDVASTLRIVLKNYPVYQNVQVVMGFIETVNLIDKLESIGTQSEMEKQGLGFRPTLKKDENENGVEALEHAKELRAKLPHLLEWLEVPEANLRAA